MSPASRLVCVPLNFLNFRDLRIRFILQETIEAEHLVVALNNAKNCVADIGLDVLHPRSVVLANRQHCWELTVTDEATKGRK